MKDALLLAISGIVAAGAAAATTLYVAAADADISSEADAAEPGTKPLQTELAALEQKQDELDRYLTTLPLAAAPADPVDQSSIVAAAVEAWLDENAAALLVASSPVGDAGASGLDPALAALREAEVGELIDLIADGSLSGEERQLAWQRIAEAGRLDDVVAELERMVELDPQDPDLRVTLGNGYLQQLFQGAAGPQAGELATMADSAFDAALRLDETHWEARFTKAVSLSNWPAFLGKQGAAIAEFELLVEQQEDRTAEPGHAQTYLFLGNMYLDTGEAAKALQTWRRGLERFPASDALREQIERNSGGGR